MPHFRASLLLIAINYCIYLCNLKSLAQIQKSDGVPEGLQHRKAKVTVLAHLHEVSDDSFLPSLLQTWLHCQLYQLIYYIYCCRST